MRILVVCTANQCRSPMAEALLRRHLAGQNIAAEISSCGFLDGGSHAAQVAIDAMKGFGIDLSEHRSRRLSPYLIAESDLILTMTREHLREIVVEDPSALGRTFTLKEFVRRSEAAGPRSPNDDDSSYVERLAHGRRTQDLMGDSPEDDVADPMLQGDDACRDVARTLDELSARVAARLAGPD